MKMEKNIEKFIELRIAGNSFDEIARELQTSKQTLIEWNKKVDIRTAIDEGNAIKINGIVKANKFNIENRLNGYLKLSQKINDELSNRDLSSVSTETLLKMSISHDSRIRELINRNIQLGQKPGIIDFTNGNGFFHLSLED